MLRGIIHRHGQALREGARDGVPIGLGYLAVSFALGIAARGVGLTPFQGFLASILNNASAGEYAAFTLMAVGGTYLQMAVVTLIANARYFLMSCALSQRFAAGTRLAHRLLVGFALTDELFGIAIARPGYVDPYYSYGAMATAMPGWAFGTALGIALGNVMPPRAQSALSVALFGMFLAIIVPPARKSRRVLAVVAASFAASLAFELAPYVSSLDSGTRIIILTIVISAVAALVFPVADGGAEELGQDEKSLASLGDDVVDHGAEGVDADER